MSTLVVGLTGGIGSGKTAVSDLFAIKGVTIVDADVIAREVVEPGQPALKAIIERFGSEMLLPDGSLNRRALREQVFNSNEDKDWLNELLHPAIRASMLRQTQQASSAYCILSVPLLVENGLNKVVDKVLVVDVDEQQQIMRTSSRDQQSKQQVEKIIAAQATREQRLAVADDVIDNNGPPSALIDQVEQLHLHYLDCVKIMAKA